MATDGFAHRWNQVEYPAADERRISSMGQMPGSASAPFSARAGRRVNGAGLNLTVSSSGNGSVTVSPGPVRIFDPNFASQGAWDAEFPNTIGPITLGARPSSGQSRIDLVVARIYDVDASVGSVREAKIEVIPGSPGATPGAPTKPALSEIIGTLTVPSSGTISVTKSANVAVSAGGIEPVPTSDDTAQLASSGAAYKGMYVHNLQTGRLETFNGSVFGPIRTAGSVSTTTDTSGYVNIAHGGSWTPTSINLLSHGGAYLPFRSTVDATTLRIRFFTRSTVVPFTTASPVNFDWSCDFV